MIKKLALQNFRNFEEKVFEFSPKTTIIIGQNGIGKTNVLEALSLLSTAKSFKALRESEMIKMHSEIARVKGRITFENNKTDLEVVLTNGNIIQGETLIKVPKKKLNIEGVSKRAVDFSGIFKTVLFLPEHMDLITSSPSSRRSYLDQVLVQVDREYRRAIHSYEKGLRVRNRLLVNIREGMSTRNDLFFWDKLVIKNGEYITGAREELIEFMNKGNKLAEKEYTIFYDKSIISESRIKEYEKEEVYAGTTLVGPHRDDIVFFEKDTRFDGGKDLAKYGSRGEQRMGVLWAKGVELNFIEEKTQSRPTLLLDDIFSELDHTHRELVKVVSQKQQTIMTTADPHFSKEFLGVDNIQL